MRLIDADALMEYCLNQKSKTIDCNEIARFPTAQPQTGEWIEFGLKGQYYCSNCKHEIMTNVLIDQRPAWKFCPNCGTRMVTE